MSLALLRGSARRLAALLVLISLWSLPHVVQADDVCRSTGVEEHDESKHVFHGSDSSTAHPEHCAICHWMRSLQPGFALRATALADPGTGSPLVPVSPAAQGNGARNRIPSRAPPSLFQ